MTQAFRYFLVFFSCCIGPHLIYSQERYTPLRITEEIILDGKFMEPAWKKAIPLSDFMQTDPTPGADATEKTTVSMLYDDQYLYVGFYCFDREPSKIVRFFMDRDFELGNDDGVSIALDTYNDKATGIVFVTNTLGARFDSEISNNGSNMNDDFNTFWDSASVLDSTGYTAEMRIPFSSLRFRQKQKVVMGFRFTRLMKRKNELVTYPRADSSLQELWANLSQAAELEFSDLKTKKPIYFTPYIIGNFNQQNFLNEDSSGYVAKNEFFSRKKYFKNETLDKIVSNIGADLKYGLSKNFTLNLTLNTDFAQAEVDSRIVNLSKYEINLPEKRAFFLESQNYLSYSVGFGTQLFNSRNIGLQDGIVVPIIGGARITGTQGSLQIGVLDMQTAEVEKANIDAQNYSAARFRKFYGHKGSFWGGIITNRMSTGNKNISNQSTAIDMVHHFNDKWLGGFGLVTTYDSVVEKVFDNNTFVNLFLFKNVNEGFSHGFDLELSGDQFNPAMGFNAETDYGFISSSNGVKKKIKGNGTLNFWKINTELNYRWKLKSQVMETRFAQATFGVSFKKGTECIVTPVSYKEDLLFEKWVLNKRIVIPAGYYKMYVSELYFNFDVSKGYTSDFDIRYGDFYGGKIFTFSANPSFILNRYLRISLAYEGNSIEFPDAFSKTGEASYKSNLVSGNLSLTLSNRLSVRVLAQYDDNSNSIGGNLRFRYNPHEGTDLYIVYNSDLNTRRLEAKPTLSLVDRQSVVIKFLKTFGL